MGSFGAGLAGFASGLSGGIALGSKLNSLVEDDKIAKVREQGIAEARAMQAAATPQVQDNGDMNNPTSNPQMSRDPRGAEPINTSLPPYVSGIAGQQNDGGPQTQPVAAPDVAADAPSDRPLMSLPPGAKPDTVENFAPNLDSAAQKGIAPLSAPKRFNVDGQEFDDRDKADTYAKSKAPKESDFYSKTLVPKMKEALIAQGKIEEAERWDKYAQDEKSRKYGETWLNAVRLAHMQDYDGAASQLMKLHPEFEDGYDLLSAEPAKGADGTSGFNMRVRGPDGKVQEMYQNSRTLVELGAPQLSPIEAFKKMDAKQTQADILMAKDQMDVRNDKRTADRQMANEIARDKAAEQRQIARDKAAADRQKTSIDANKDRDTQRSKDKADQIRLAASERAKLDAQRFASLGAYRKAVSPEERQAIVVSGLSKDPMFNLLSADEKRQRVEETMALIPQAKPAAGATGTTVPNPGLDPRQQGVSAGAAPAGKKAVTIYDPATGQMKTVYR